MRKYMEQEVIKDKKLSKTCANVSNWFILNNIPYSLTLTSKNKKLVAGLVI